MTKEPNFKSGTIWVNDNLPVLREMVDECIDLIYLDPPFNSNRIYEGRGESKGTGFSDIFKNLTEVSSDPDYEYGELAKRDDTLIRRAKNAGEDHSIPMENYLIFLNNRLLELHRILSPTGSIYLHCDDTAVHYIKQSMDCIFGPNNFINQIVWKRVIVDQKGNQHKSRNVGRNADYILHYSKTSKYYYEEPTKALSEVDIAKKFPKIDEDGRRFKIDSHVFRSPSNGPRPNLCYTYNNVSPPEPWGWRWKKEKLEELDKDGRIIWRKGKNPFVKKYADDYAGEKLGNIWDDIPPVMGSESTGTATQKPEELLKRIILSSTKERDWVLDPFCGCATTCHVANLINRKWAGIDRDEIGYTKVKQRIDKAVGLGFANRTKVIKAIDPPSKYSLMIKKPTPKEKARYKEKQYGVQRGCCANKYCMKSQPIDYDFIEIDHKTPLSKGGTEDESNKHLLCRHCNGPKRKGIKTWEEFQESEKKRVQVEGCF